MKTSHIIICGVFLVASLYVLTHPRQKPAELERIAQIEKNQKLIIEMVGGVNRNLNYLAVYGKLKKNRGR